MKRQLHGFTLPELLVSIAILLALVLLVTQLVNGVASTVSHGTKHMETESHLRPLFDQMAIDIAQMVKRSDVAFYLKSAGDTMDTSSDRNDRLAFFSAVAGYYNDNSQGYNSGYSVISYRMNADSTKSQYNRLERMAKGLPMNAAVATSSTTMMPLLFTDSTNPNSINTTLDKVWPAATRPLGDPNYYSSDQYQSYELVGPQIFRFEYYYLTRVAPTTLVAYPTSGFRNATLNWSSANTVNIADVSAIIVAIAVIDSQSRILLSDSQLRTLSNLLGDFNTGMQPGELLSAWQTVLDSNPTVLAMPRPAIQGVRLYERYFYLNQ